MIHLTENAASHISNYLKNRGKGEGIRVGVKTSGCSGLAYVLEFVDDIDEHDQIFEQFGVKVFVDPKSLVYLDGLEMDYVKNGLNEGFEFNNPNKTVNSIRRFFFLPSAEVLSATGLDEPKPSVDK
ncbi:iron-sulfur cluster assembly accessory family protein [Acinetobacter baumannii 26016_3]|nr:iron-sulfur cluster assembly accessory family protein [Acinetobacter baumannii 26016_3]